MSSLPAFRGQVRRMESRCPTLRSEGGGPTSLPHNFLCPGRAGSLRPARAPAAAAAKRRHHRIGRKLGSRGAAERGGESTAQGSRRARSGKPGAAPHLPRRGGDARRGCPRGPAAGAERRCKQRQGPKVSAVGSAVPDSDAPGGRTVSRLARGEGEVGPLSSQTLPTPARAKFSPQELRAPRAPRPPSVPLETLLLCFQGTFRSRGRERSRDSELG